MIGVSASGMTPFVRGGLTRARKAGAKIIFVTCWPGSELQNFVDLQIAPAVGPEIIAGSTRLKAGTATKMVLNMLTTVAMIKVGKTYGNLMVDVQTGSEKLKDRARRIVGIVTGLDYDEADALLKRARWNVKAAIVMQKAKLTLPQALKRLKKADDSVREAIGEDIEVRLRELLRKSVQILTPARGRLVQHDLDVAVQLQERRRQLGRDRTVERPLRRTPPSTALSRAARSTGPEGSSPFPSTAPRRAPRPHLRRTARHCAAGFGLERDAVRPRGQHRPRLVETDVAVGADAEDLDVDAARVRDRLFVARALAIRIGGRAVQKVDLIGAKIHAAEQVLVHEPAVAARVRRPDAEELVEVERPCGGEIGAAVRGQRRQLVVEGDRRSAGRQSEHESRIRCQRRRDRCASARAAARSYGNTVIRRRTRHQSRP